ncbi:MAG: hypothetical protein FWC36_10555 [Spirochaetes bacterium]|nr:hypothetical protein [Spirochaetota bacterium]
MKKQTSKYNHIFNISRLEEKSQAVIDWKKQISEWLAPKNLLQAKGKTRKEIFALFGNEYEPIAAIPLKYLKYLGDDITNQTVYSGKGYFIDHAVNHHPEVDAVEYQKIPDILSNPDDVKLDNRKPSRNSLVFIKKHEKYDTAVVSVDTTDEGKIVIHKTYFVNKKSPYTQLQSIWAKSSDDANTSISHAGNPASAGKRFSALDDTSSLSSKNDQKSSKT